MLSFYWWENHSAACLLQSLWKESITQEENKQYKYIYQIGLLNVVPN